MSKYLITAALPYANGKLHFGHIAGCYLPADIVVRYLKLASNDVLFICGSDEHGVAITLSSEKLKIPYQEYVDIYHNEHIKFFSKLNIVFDYYGRTSAPLHHEQSQDFFSKILKKGYITEKKAKQFYCENCKRFLADRYITGTCPECNAPRARGDECLSCGQWLNPESLIDPKCSICNSMPKISESEHFYFDLPKFKDRLSNWLAEKKKWKDHVLNMALNLINKGLVQRAITRDLPWGVNVPIAGYENKVLYVWFDAPIGYISISREWATQKGEPDKWKEYWQNKNTRLIQFMGKDNIIFHTIVWPSMLMALEDEGWILPDIVSANNFFNLSGKQFSKSEGIYIETDEFFKEFNTDYLRFYLASVLPEYSDSDFSYEIFQSKINDELADIVGNLVNRTFSFINNFFNGEISDFSYEENHQDNKNTNNEILKLKKDIENYFETIDLRKALNRILDFARFGNKFLADREPWKTRKQNEIECKRTLLLTLEIIKTLCIFLYPFIPETSEKIWKALGFNYNLETKNLEYLLATKLQNNKKIEKLDILFKKIENETIDKFTKKEKK
jgi:methionyl-tRNA synthetase